MCSSDLAAAGRRKMAAESGVAAPCPADLTATPRARARLRRWEAETRPLNPGRTRRRQDTAGTDMGCAAADEGNCMCGGEAMKSGFFGGFGRHGMVRARRATSRGLARRAVPEEGGREG